MFTYISNFLFAIFFSSLRVIFFARGSRLSLSYQESVTCFSSAAKNESSGCKYKMICFHTIIKVKFLSKNSILTTPQHFQDFFTQFFFFFWQFISWNQSCQQLKSPKPQHFHEIFTQKNRQFSREIKVEFLDKKWRFRTVCGLSWDSNPHQEFFRDSSQKNSLWRGPNRTYALALVVFFSGGDQNIKVVSLSASFVRVDVRVSGK